MLSAQYVCIGSISLCCFVVPLFRCSSHVLLFRGIPIVPPVFRYSAGVPCSVVLCSGVPGFIVCPFDRTPLMAASGWRNDIGQKHPPDVFYEISVTKSIF